MRETWYVLEDGSVVNPSEVAHDEQGILRHSSGVAVAMRGQAPSSRGVDLDDLPSEAKDMKPAAAGRKYKTRESKAD